jgi:hypothetical protein
MQLADGQHNALYGVLPSAPLSRVVVWEDSILGWNNNGGIQPADHVES